MVCNHCTKAYRSEFYYRTSSGYICHECRKEIISADSEPCDPVHKWPDGSAATAAALAEKGE